MKKINLFLLILIVVGFSCRDSQIDENLSIDQTHLTETEAYLEAVNAVTEFSEMVSYDPTVQTKSSDQNLKIAFGDMQVIKSNKPKTKSAEETIDSLILYTFDIEKDGNHGFAIASGDNRIKKVYAYVENGSIADTARILGMAQMISNIPAICTKDLEDYAESTPSTKATSSCYFLAGSMLITKWEQGEPYNTKLPTNGACGNQYYPVGCTAIALGQSMAYYKRCNRSFDFEALTAQPQIYTYSPVELKDEVSNYLKYVADNIYSSYGCNSTGSSPANCRNLLTASGYSYEYAKTSDIDRNKLFVYLRSGNPVLASGIRSGGVGHAWLIDGMYGTFPEDNISSTLPH
jgi:hypothetical protein